LRTGTTFGALRQWVTAIAVYAVALHGLAMAAMPGTVLGPRPAAAEHAAVHESAVPGGSHSEGNHLQCCVLCSVAGCGGPSSKAPGLAIRARARDSARPPRRIVSAARNPIVRASPPRGPPAAA
jgi:hypothetical protein